MRNFRNFRKLQLALLGLAILAAGAPALAQPIAIGPLVPKVSPAVSVIPADAMAYVVINDIEAAAGHFETFVDAIGVGDQLPKPLLGEMLKNLGKEFAPADGIAIAVLNPKDYGLDPRKLMQGQQPEGPYEIPVVLCVPAKTIAGVLPEGLPTQQEGGKTVIKGLTPMPLYAVKHNGCVLLSPSAKALDAVQGVRKVAAGQLTPKQLGILAKADVFINFNMSLLGPLYLELMEENMAQMKAMQEMGMGGPGAEFLAIIKPLMDASTKMNRQMMKELNNFCFAVRMGKNGAMLEMAMDYDANGMLARSSAVPTAAAADLLAGMPAKGYVLAAAGRAAGRIQPEQQEMIDAIVKTLENAPLPIPLPDGTGDKLKGLIKGFSKQITGVKIVAGGSTGAGVFGLTAVLDCKDATEVRTLIARKAKFVHDLVQAMGADEEEIKGLKVAYEENVETVAGVTIDAVTLTHPKMAEMPEHVRGQMTAALGEDKIRFLVASPNAKTVVVSFGGSTGALAAALQTQGAPLLRAEGVAAALAQMPAKLNSLMLFSPGNLMAAIKDGANRMEQPGAADDIPSLASKAPIVMGAVAGKTEAHVVFSVPSGLVKDLYKLGQAMSPRRGRRPRPMPGDGEDDF